jgi:hypothetical protein
MLSTDGVGVSAADSQPEVRSLSSDSGSIYYIYGDSLYLCLFLKKTPVP